MNSTTSTDSNAGSPIRTPPSMLATLWSPGVRRSFMSRMTRATRSSRSAIITLPLVATSSACLESITALAMLIRTSTMDMVVITTSSQCQTLSCLSVRYFLQPPMSFTLNRTSARKTQAQIASRKLHTQCPGIMSELNPMIRQLATTATDAAMEATSSCRLTEVQDLFSVGFVCFVLNLWVPRLVFTSFFFSFLTLLVTMSEIMPLSVDSRLWSSLTFAPFFPRSKFVSTSNNFVMLYLSVPSGFSWGFSSSRADRTSSLLISMDFLFHLFGSTLTICSKLSASKSSFEWLFWKRCRAKCLLFCCSLFHAERGVRNCPEGWTLDCPTCASCKPPSGATAP
mmetsp:Transcript_7050/g.20801  ORF Transcript_7050/g.20801 Transcript_7050/m.20801 type:complete len:340 (-) Transcript_7050:128-1147(-)